MDCHFNENHLVKICDEFFERRKSYYKKRWLNFKATLARWFKSSLDYPSSYRETLKYDLHFISEFYEWLQYYIHLKNISKDELETYIKVLHAHKKNLIYRSRFLVILVALFGGVIEFCRSYLGWLNDHRLSIYIVFFPICIALALNERAFLLDKSSAIDQLIEILEEFID